MIIFFILMVQGVNIFILKPEVHYALLPMKQLTIKNILFTRKARQFSNLRFRKWQMCLLK